jgi:hypothetical protein
MSDKEQEPVAWRWRGPRGGWISDDTKPTWPSEPLYASPALSPSVCEGKVTEYTEGRVHIIEQSDTLDGGTVLTLSLDGEEAVVIVRFSAALSQDPSK